MVLRFLIGDVPELYLKAEEIFKQIENHSIWAILLESVFTEIIFVLEKVYKVERHIIQNHLQKILALKGIVNPQKEILYRALEIYAQSKFDIVDCLLAAYGKINEIEIISFDEDIRRAMSL